MLLPLTTDQRSRHRWWGVWHFSWLGCHLFNYHALPLRCTPGHTQTKVIPLMDRPIFAFAGLIFHPRQGGSAGSQQVNSREKEIGVVMRGGDTTAGVLQQQRSGMTWERQTHTPGKCTCSHLGCWPQKSRGRQSGHTLHTDKRQTHSHVASRGEFNLVLPVQGWISWRNFLFVVCVLSVVFAASVCGQ